MAIIYRFTINFASAELDSYEKGCDPDSNVLVHVGQEQFTGASPVDVLTQVAEYFNLEADAFDFSVAEDLDEPGRVDIQLMSSSLDSIQEDFKNWEASFKAGSKDLWLVNISGTLTQETIEPINMTDFKLETL